MEYQLLNQTNPCYSSDLLNRYRCLYSGGKLFRDNIKRFLTKLQNEDTSIYEYRVKQASYRSYVGPIIDHFGAQVFSAPYTIRANNGEEDGYGNLKEVELDPFYAEFKEDVDVQGTDLTSFMKHQLITSLICGKAYWLAEMPEVTEEIKTLADYQANDLGRARLVDLEPECVLDYAVDDYGQYEWIILYYKECPRSSPTQSRKNITETWKIFYPDHVEVYEITHPKDKPLKPTDIIPLVESYEHGFTKVPIICLDLPMGLWLMDRVAEAQIEHFRLSAALGYSLRRSAYAMGIFNLEDKNHPPIPSAVGITIGLEDKFQFAEPSGSSFATLQKEISDQKDEIYRVTQQMAQSADNSAGSLGRSGESKQADFEATNICCKSYGILIREAIEKTFELISDARGDQDIKFSIEGLDKYNFTDATALIANVKIVKDLGLPSSTFMKEIYSQVSESLLKPDTKQEIKDQIRKEIQEAEIDLTTPEEKKQKALIALNNNAEDLQNLNGQIPDKNGNQPNIGKDSTSLSPKPMNNKSDAQ